MYLMTSHLAVGVIRQLFHLFFFVFFCIHSFCLFHYFLGGTFKLGDLCICTFFIFFFVRMFVRFSFFLFLKGVVDL